MTYPNPSPQEQLNAWLDACERDLVHPAVVLETLKRQGWGDWPANATTVAYRRRFNEHPVGYTTLLVSTGLGALAVGSIGHTLANGMGGHVDRYAVAFWLTVLLCCLPALAWGHQWAAAVDAEDPVAVWSGPRRALTRTLLWACALVGGGRVFYYGLQLISYLVGAHWFGHDQLSRGAVNVGIALAITVPLGRWAYRFLHRFDAEDPSRPPARRHRPAPTPTGTYR